MHRHGKPFASLDRLFTPNAASSRNSSPGRGVFLHHACVFQHVGPLAARPGVAVLQMLAEVVCPVKLLGRVALSELVHVLQMPDPLVPVMFCGVPRYDAAAEGTVPGTAAGPGELVAAVAARIGLARAVRRVVKSAIVARKRRTRPRVAADVQRVLVALGFVLVLEAVAAEQAFVLLLSFVGAG